MAERAAVVVDHSAGAGELERVLATSGWAVVSGFDRMPLKGQRAAFVELCGQLGELLPQDADGTLVRAVADRTHLLAQTDVRYSDSRAGGGFHTDGVGFEDPVPDYFALLCERQAGRGGDLVLIDCADVADRLAARAPEAMPLLEQPVRFGRRGSTARREDGWEPIKRPILRRSGDGGSTIAYLRDYIEAAYAPGELRPDFVAALDALDDVLDDDTLQHRCLLAPGEAAFVANQRFLHGRVAFEDGGAGEERRLLWRVWVRASAAPGRRGTAVTRAR